ncbi:MAG: pilus assembly protein TadG-related protein [Acidimicrobiia bacterium]
MSRAEGTDMHCARTDQYGSPADGRDAGVVAAWFALLLTVFIGLAALGVDVGTWYLRSQQLQRAADAASLAAVVYMPDTTQADAAARVSLAKNRIDTARVVVTAVQGSTDRQFKVTLTDNHVPTFFGRIFRDEITISRTALAEYTSPIRMGSPQNYLGWGGAALPLESGVPATAATPNFWLALNGYCTAKEQGDLLSARYDGNATPVTSPHCGPVLAPTGTYAEDQSVSALPGQVPSYHADGYLYAVTVPAASTKVSIYDPGYCPDGAGAIDKKLIGTGSIVPLQYVLRSPDTAGTPNDYSDDPIVASGTFSDCSGALTWVDIATLTSAGRYALEIKTPEQANSLGANLFSLRATASSSNLCDARINGAGCPQVSGLSALSIMATVGAGSAKFSFAEVAAGYAGKQMVIGLWDPGEGMNNIQVLDPAGNPAEFRVRVTPSLGGGAPAFAPTAVNTLDVSGCGAAYTQPGPNRAGNCIYNDRLVELLVQLPATYTGGWWSVVYAGGSTPTDRTTWSIRIVGDPVHLARP